MKEKKLKQIKPITPVFVLLVSVNLFFKEKLTFYPTSPPWVDLLSPFCKCYLKALGQCTAEAGVRSALACSASLSAMVSSPAQVWPKEEAEQRIPSGNGTEDAACTPLRPIL